MMYAAIGLILILLVFFRPVVRLSARVLMLTVKHSRKRHENDPFIRR